MNECSPTKKCALLDTVSIFVVTRDEMIALLIASAGPASVLVISCGLQTRTVPHLDASLSVNCTLAEWRGSTGCVPVIQLIAVMPSLRQL